MFSLSLRRNFRVAKALWTTSLVMFCLVWSCSVAGAAAGKFNIISGLSSKWQGEGLQIRIHCDSEPIYHVYGATNSNGIVVDVENGKLKPGSSFSLPRDSGVNINVEPKLGLTPPLVSFVFTPNKKVSFSDARQGNDIVLTLKGLKDGASAAQAGSVVAGDAMAASLAISDVKVEKLPQETKIKLVANGKLTSYKHEVVSGNPAKLYIDVNGVSGTSLLKTYKVDSAKVDNIQVAKRGSGLRFILTAKSEQIFPFEINSSANGLEVVVREDADDEISALIKEKKNVKSQLPDVQPLQADKKGKSATAFSSGGDRITVDFYKIDLHNVFRLLREVSGKNIVVDEAVEGSLTLALDDVPWDFALDIILSLKDLKKKEKFNTIVILPADKEYDWSEKPGDKLSVVKNKKLAVEESMVIKQKMNISPEVTEAKKLIDKARKLEKADSYEKAVVLYEQAFKKWPKNAQLANKIASLYLVQLRNNAKALYYAQKAMAADKNNDNALLTAAIAAANMHNYKVASQYFDRLVMKKRPIKEGLQSYAAFAEERGYYENALKLLQKHDNLYGATLGSMVARARILDKQGMYDKATRAYQEILLSGYRISSDLRKFIEQRIAQPKAM